MKLGIISDTHDYLQHIPIALNFFLENGIDIIFHCGDWTKPETLEFISEEAHKRRQKVYGVLGNNDLHFKNDIYEVNEILPAKIKLPRISSDFLIFKYRKRNFGIFHGDNKSRLNQLLLENNFEALFVGHSHRPKIDFIHGTKVLNPGSLSFSIPYKKKGEEVITVGIYDLQSRNFEVYEI